jgi:hypothetical protein
LQREIAGLAGVYQKSDRENRILPVLCMSERDVLQCFDYKQTAFPRHRRPFLISDGNPCTIHAPSALMKSQI